MSNTQNTEQLRVVLAEALGEQPEAIKAENPRWAQLMKEGVLISLSIGRWRAKTGLSWQDLGIQLGQEEDNKLEELLALGYKKLLPAKFLARLDSIESGARKWLQKRQNSYKTYWGQFVPVSAYAEWKQKNQEYKDQYFAVRDEIVANYDQLIQEILISYEIGARQAYSRLQTFHPEALKNFKSEESFVLAFLDKIQEHLATPEKIKESFYFNVELKYIPLQSLMAEDEAEAERIRLETEAERSRVRVEEEKHWIEVREARTASEMRERMLREINQDVMAQAKKQKEEQVDDFLKNIVSQLRGLVYDATTDVLTAIRRKDGLGPRSIVQLKNMIEQVKSLNFYGDDEVDRMINQVQIQLSQDVDSRDLSQIDQNLADIATITRASLIGLGEQPRRARQLGIADNPTPEMVRTARRGLGLEVEEQPVMVLERGQRRLVEVEL